MSASFLEINRNPVRVHFMDYSEDALTNREYYGYDAVGNKIWFTNKKGSAAEDINYTWHYAYDKANRLTTETTHLWG